MFKQLGAIGKRILAPFTAAIMLVGAWTFVCATAAFIWSPPHAKSALLGTGDFTPASGTLTLLGRTTVGTYSITAGSELTNSGIATLGDTSTGIGLMTIDGIGSLWRFSSGTADITVGNSGTGSISLTNFGTVDLNDDTFMAVQENSYGRIDVNGLGSLWDNGDDMVIGDRGLAIVNVTSGGRLLSDAADVGNTATGEGDITVSGQFSLWQATGAIAVGDLGRGSLSIADGGRVVTSLPSTIGNAANSYGFADVSGKSSYWQFKSGMTVGASGTGVLQVRDQGRVTTAGNATLATSAESRSNVLVDGTGSEWNVALQLTTGLGESDITISNGGAAIVGTSATFTAASQVHLNGGRLEVTGNSGITNRGLVRGSGTIDTPNFSNAATGSVRGRIHTDDGERLVLTGNLANAAIVDLDGGEFEVRGNTTNTSQITAMDTTLIFGGTGLTNNSGSQLSVIGGTVNVFGSINNNFGSAIVVGADSHGVFHHSISGSGQIVVKPGSDILLLQNLNFAAAASLAVELSAVDLTDPGADPSDGYGQVHVAGAADLQGTLSVSLLYDYLPNRGDTFQILTAAGGITGGLSTLDPLPALGRGLTWNLQQDANSLLLSVVVALPGDYDFSGIVDAADFTVWRDTQGKLDGDFAADGNGDGVIDGSDYEIWKLNYGNVLSSNAAPNSVPEPAIAALTFLGGMVTLMRGRRGRSAKVSRNSPAAE